MGQHYVGFCRLCGGYGKLSFEHIQLGSLDAMVAYYDSLKMTLTPSRAWAEGILEAYEQIRMYDA